MARVLNAYARDESPFAKIGRQTVTIEATEVTRASTDTFAVRWDERTFKAGVVVKTERFMGALSIAFKSPNVADAISRNPLEVYVDRFTWWREPSARATG